MLEVLILGTAAGGGFPQWNCACENCDLVRSGKLAPRLQSALAVSGDGEGWHLVNASPDVARQIERFIRPRLQPSVDERRSPVRRVFLTNADLDHTLGLFQLREGGPCDATAPPPVRATLERGLSVGNVLGAYGGIRWRTAETSWGPVDESGLEFRAVPLAGGAPRYDAAPGPGPHAVGYLFRRGSATVGIFPDVAQLDDHVRDAMNECARVWFDGTFWTEDEMLARSGRTAADMGHIPIGGERGSLGTLAALGPDRAAYLHINNTNPILRPDSAERLTLERAGVRVAGDGEHFVF